jgi:hypothetical protein
MAAAEHTQNYNPSCAEEWRARKHAHALVSVLKLANDEEMVLISTCSNAPVGASTM